METAPRNDWNQGFQNIYWNLLPVKSERLNANIKLSLHKAQIRSDQ
jgi:hypothetical protein